MKALLKKMLTGLTAAGLLTTFCSLPLRADSITNGSFETPVVPVGGFTNLASGSTGITGWTVVGAAGGVSIVSGSFSQNGISFPAENGVQWLDLTGDGTNSNEGVQQTFATTSGTEYTLSFWVGNVYNPGGIFGTTSTVDVRLGDVVVLIEDQVRAGDHVIRAGGEIQVLHPGRRREGRASASHAGSPSRRDRDSFGEGLAASTRSAGVRA